MIAFLLPLATRIVGPRLARAAIWATLAALLIIGLGVAKCAYDSRQRAETNIAKRQTAAAQESGKDAVNTLGKSQAVERASDDITRENDSAIRSAPGADAPVDTRARDAGLDGLCRRNAYRDSAKCLQRTSP